MRSRLFSSLKRPLTEGPSFSDFLSKAASGAEIELPKSTKLPELDVSPKSTRLPEWLKTPIAVGEKYSNLKETLRGLKLHTVRFEGEK